MSIPGAANPLLLATAAAGGYQISRSLRFSSIDSAYLSRTPASAGNRKTWTWAGWVKRCALGSLQFLFTGTLSGSGGNSSIAFNSDDTIYFRYLDAAASFTTTAVFRDPSAWYHIVAVADTDNATANDRLAVYVNGVRQLGTISAPTLGQSNGYINFNNVHFLGTQSTTYSNFYLADVHFIDGQALTPTSFGEFDTNGVWQPKAYSGSYGTNGFRLDFADNSSAAALGYDAAGSNDWTVNNLSVAAGAGNDSLRDSPTNGSQTDTGVGGEVVGNYCTLNPLSKGSLVTLANGNLEASATASSGNGPLMRTFGTVSPSAGSYYFEATNLSNRVAGIATENAAQSVAVYSGGVSNTSGGSATGGSTTISSSDIIGIALDVTNNSVTFYKNNTQFYRVTGMNSSYKWFPHGAVNASASASTELWNFGQRQWAYAAPAGFKALCTTNLPTPTIADGSTVMDVALWTGNGAASRTISGLGFSPDLVWIKSRSTAGWHALVDQVRGAGKILASNDTASEYNNTGSNNAFQAFTSDGFTIGQQASWVVNDNSVTQAAWTWDAGSSTVTNTQGSITSQVRANPSAGFSIVTYTGTGANATVGHGLGVALSFVVVKSRSSADDWYVYHSSIGATKYLQLNTTASAATAVTVWNNTTPTSTVLSIGTASSVNGNTVTFVAYCFAPVAGYSAFGSYTGNGSTDGPFVFCNFRPRWVMIKSTSFVSDWCIFDAARDGYNANNDSLYPNSSNYENYYVLENEFDILSNGFKPRANRDRINQSSATYVWAAFAESPFQYARAR